MSSGTFVAGDWGTSHLRLFLCDAEGLVLDSGTGPGAADTHGRFATVLSSLMAPWQERYGPLPAVLCGMVGSNIGWAQAPYVPCPANPEQIVDACVALHGGTVHIVPGLSCRNRFNAPDFLRGEETQILGAMQLEASLGEGLRLLCLPGTHTKWAVVEDGWIREFFSAPTGELFAVLRDHSVLVRNQGMHDAADSDAFRKGMTHFNEFPQAQLLHRLFECRARQLSGELTAQAAEAYLSGLLIASDVHGALRLLPESATARPICLIGSSELTQRYAGALTLNGREAHRVDGAAASLAGLAQVHRRLSHREVTHEI
jgi:2-dehydro-3-deoxygalactonokinase